MAALASGKWYLSGTLAESFQSGQRHVVAVAKCHNYIAVYFLLVHRFLKTAFKHYIKKITIS